MHRYVTIQFFTVTSGTGAIYTVCFVKNVRVVSFAALVLSVIAGLYFSIIFLGFSALDNIHIRSRSVWNEEVRLCIGNIKYVSLFSVIIL